MKAKQQLLQLLLQYTISVSLPPRLKDDERANEAAFSTILSICQKLIATQASLLNKETVEILLRTAQNGNFIGERMGYFAAAIDFLNEEYAENTTLPFHDIFHVICRVTNSTLAHRDIGNVLLCTFQLNRLNLLTQENIRLLVDSLVNVPRQLNIAQQQRVTSSSIVEREEASRAEQLYHWLSRSQEISQEDFNFMIRTKAKVCDAALYMKKLDEQKLKTPENFQALVDAEFKFKRVDKQLPSNQPDLDALFFNELRQKLIQLSTVGQNLRGNFSAISEYVHALHAELYELSLLPEAQDTPRELLHTTAVILKALPRYNNTPSKADIEELIALANEAQGHPSPARQRVGKIMMALGGAIALAVGIILTFSTVGIACPLGIGLAAAGIVGGVSLLAGFGIFTNGKRRTGMSKDMVNLATEVEKLETATAVH